MQVTKMILLSIVTFVVTVCCFRKLGDDTKDTKQNLLSNKSNETSVGNVAYIALHHPSAVIRDRFSQQIQKWKQAQTCVLQ